jgi:hypothetical protein
MVSASVKLAARTHSNPSYMWWNLSVLAGQLYNPITRITGRKALYRCILFTLSPEVRLEHSRNLPNSSELGRVLQ